MLAARLEAAKLIPSSRHSLPDRGDYGPTATMRLAPATTDAPDESEEEEAGRDPDGLTSKRPVGLCDVCIMDSYQSSMIWTCSSL